MLSYLNDLPESFKKELSGNFCAIKYVHNLPEKKRKKVIEKAARMNETELKNYVQHLGNNY
ncbi:MAG: hypothetical protein IIU39_08725 [Ruminococcus sp.]|nr:hypothetical protein [Ruminococcus sp.]